jgi:hypothetical protein
LVGVVADIGTRIELVPMDGRFEDISIALYRRESGGAPVGHVHTYSHKPGVDARVQYVAETMAILGGLDGVADEAATLRFPCGTWHEAAVKRVFLEACKADPAQPVIPRPLDLHDRRSGQHITLEKLGGGAYRVHAQHAEGEESRARVVANGLAKLGRLAPDEDGVTVTFQCGTDHDALVGLLLVRAPNVRAVLREEEAAALRGILAAPSAQER